MLLAVCSLSCRSGETALDPAAIPPVPTGLESVVSEHLEEQRNLLLESEPGLKRSEAWGAFGKAAHAYSLNDIAQRAYLEAERLNPDDFRWPYYRARVAQDQGDSAAAHDFFERALELRVSDRSARLGLAQSLLDLGRASEAMDQLEDLTERQSGDALVWLALGEAQLALGETQAAILSFERVLTLQPSATRVHAFLATAYRSVENLPAAEAHVALRGEGQVKYEDPWMLAVAAEKRGVDASIAAGTAAFERGAYLEAANHFREAVNLDSERADAWLNLGVVLVEIDAESAGDAFRESIRLEPTRPKAYFNLGTLESAQGQADLAIENFLKALELDPDYTSAAVNLGNIYLRKGSCRLSEGVFHPALLRDPSRSDVRLGLVLSLSCLDRDSEAMQLLEEPGVQDSNSEILRNALARLLAAGRGQGVRDGERAVSLAQSLITKETSLEFVETLAMALAEARRFDEAVEWQSRGIEAARGSGQTRWLQALEANLQRYRAGKSAKMPWSTIHPQSPSPPA